MYIRCPVVATCFVKNRHLGYRLFIQIRGIIFQYVCTTCSVTVSHSLDSLDHTIMKRPYAACKPTAEEGIIKTPIFVCTAHPFVFLMRILLSFAVFFCLDKC
ncbi:uncharacterized protein A4U43_C04F25210 [Asparagus officinalis]|uniref:Uncharacterized protein n=1 Tax=Asparagus officinalis TaxID=4686 RepID=A0A5P1F494_ASPOF|nr:uncharacterized protein A4U43_C04F25210 [Asparagus officinalis]